MPRNFGQFTTSIYRDDDFRALTLAQQGAYFMLGLQPDITAAGVLTLALGRWASKAADLTRSDLEAELHVLQDRGHIAIDEATEELLLVKFAKWDRGWANRKRLPVLITAVKAIESVHIRDIAVDELRKVAASDALSTEEKQARDALSDALSGLHRVGVTEGDYGLDPQPVNHERDPSPPAADDLSSPFCATHQPNGPGGKPCTDCADRQKAQKHKAARAALADAEAQTFAAQQRRECIRCNDQGFIEDGSGVPIGRCSHSDLKLVGGVA